MPQRPASPPEKPGAGKNSTIKRHVYNNNGCAENADRAQTSYLPPSLEASPANGPNAIQPKEKRLEEAIRRATNESAMLGECGMTSPQLHNGLL